MVPYSVVKHAQCTSIRQLIQEIENHPDRHALQKELRQNQSFNLLSRIKTKDVGNIEFCELLETEPKTQHTQYVYHTGIPVYSTARARTSCINKEGQISNSSLTRLIFFQFQSMSSRKEDFMDIHIW